MSASVYPDLSPRTRTRPCAPQTPLASARPAASTRPSPAKCREQMMFHADASRPNHNATCPHACLAHLPPLSAHPPARSRTGPRAAVSKPPPRLRRSAGPDLGKRLHPTIRCGQECLSSHGPSNKPFSLSSSHSNNKAPATDLCTPGRRPCTPPLDPIERGLLVPTPFL